MSLQQSSIKIKPLNPDAVIPNYATDGSAGFDLKSIEDYSLAPGKRKDIGTGLSVEIEKGYELQIRPRSGLALKYGITIPNSPGTIDSDYRGEIKVILMNLGEEIYEIKKGDKIAQAVLAPFTRATFEVVSELEKTARGSGGFGSTGQR